MILKSDLPVALFLTGLYVDLYSRRTHYALSFRKNINRKEIVNFSINEIFKFDVTFLLINSNNINSSIIC